MKRIKFVLIWPYALCWIFPSNGVAQTASNNNYPSVNIVSPTSSSLGKFVDFPVSSHTGVPEITIPIYTIQEGPHSRILFESTSQ